MKIGFSSFVLQGGKTGIGIYIRQLIDGLQRIDEINDYRIFLTEEDASLLPDPSTNCSHRFSASGVVAPVPNILWHNTVLPCLTRLEQFDLVHIPTFRRIPYLRGCKIVATIHDLSTLKIAQKYGWARHLYHHYFLTKLLPRCDQLITVSEYTKQDIIELTGFPADRIQVIYSGIDHGRFRPTGIEGCRERLEKEFALKGPFISYISRIEHPAKNHLNLIKAFEQFKKRCPSDLHLVLAGADWNGADVVHAYAKESPVSHEIHFLGYVSEEAIVDIYNASELMIFPSYLEGFGFPIVEAMACGTPVACSNTSAMRELAEGRAVTFDPTSINEMAQAMEDGLETSFQDRARAEGPRYAAGFNWDECARQVLEVYQKCAET